MSKYISFALILGLILLCGCSSDDPTPSQPNYSAKHIWPRGSRPIPSPSGEAVLFIQEESPAGLYLLRDSVAVLMNDNPSVRSDYSWSRSGNNFCYSVLGSNGGIYVQSRLSGSSPVRIWDKGSNPRFLSGDTLIVCAGPEDGSPSEGLWQISCNNLARTHIIEHGLSPQVSPDARKIACLMTGGNSEGRILLIYNWQEQYIDTVGLNVLNYTWLGDSETLVYETGSASGSNLIKTQIGNDPPGQFLGINGSNPSGFGSLDKFFYTEILGDSLVGIFLGRLNSETDEVFLGGSNATATSEEKVFAQAIDGLYVLTH